MPDPSTPARKPDPLAPLRGKLPPGWECWTGIGGILYARRRKSSPPVVLRAASAHELGAMVAEWEAAHGPAAGEPHD
jgi:hypothetical protein